MTYIIAGKIENETFMMSDCIVTNKQTGKKTFNDKTVKLVSSPETYYSFTGVQFVDNCVRIYDFWLSLNDRTNDFITGINSINELKSVIDKMVDSFPDKENLRLGENRLFFIDMENVAFYDLEFNNACKLSKNIEKNILENGFLIDSVINFPQEEILLYSKTIEEFCESHLDKISKQIDLKSRFTFVHLQKGKSVIYKQPYKYFSDLIAVYNELDYDLIDNTKFQWNI